MNGSISKYYTLGWTFRFAVSNFPKSGQHGFNAQIEMAYRLIRGEEVPAGVRRIAREQLQAAVAHLRSRTGSRDEQIHDARKCMKRLRALVRLVRTELGKETYRRENACYRGVAAKLSALRDAAALVETFDALTAWLGKRLPPDRFGAVRSRLIEGRELAHRSGGVTPFAVEAAVEELEQADGRAAEWPLRDGWRGLEAGLRRIYEQGGAEFGAAASLPTDEGLHDWRKRVKYLWYHQQILGSIWPEQMSTAIAQADALGGMLGNDHDLSVLSAALRERFADTEDPRTLAELDRAIAERRQCLQIGSMRLARRIYAEKPGAFCRRMRSYWEAWEQEACGGGEPASGAV